MSIGAPHETGRGSAQNEQAESRQYIDSDTDGAPLADAIFMG